MWNKTLFLVAVTISTNWGGISAVPSSPPPMQSQNKIGSFLHQIYEDALYFSAGTIFGSAYLLTRLGWEICRISPWATTTGNECLLFNHVCGIAAKHAFLKLFHRPSSSYAGICPSHTSWHENQALLSQIPASTTEQKQLLHFLEKRWLAKSTGLYSSLVDWIFPCFGISIQVHPETTNSYARDPANKFSQTYLKRLEDWKRLLPHPDYFPLILTRPADLRNYLPSYLEMSAEDSWEMLAEKVALKELISETDVIVDFTAILPKDADREQWFDTWKNNREQFSTICEKLNVNLNHLIPVQRIQQGEIGGIRILSWHDHQTASLEKNHLFLLEWVSKFGLSANRIELDRWPDSSFSSKKQNLFSQTSKPLSKDDFICYIRHLEINAKESDPQKDLMLKGTLQILIGLFTQVTESQWYEILNCPTRSSLIHLAFFRMKDHFELLMNEKEHLSFFDAACQIELIHSDLSALIEIFSPFSSEDFPVIYRNLLTCIPANLQPMTSFGIHSSGMTSLTGIIKAVENTSGTTPHILYGENTYFEIIHVAEKISHSTPIEEATEKDWEDADLLLVQFNPVLKRIDFEVTEYKLENISETLRQALHSKREKPLTLALDCTLDYLNSWRVSQLLEEFQDAIKNGRLNVVCYRSGLKFDLFGMDNYCGAPFYMIHNEDSKWDFFNALSEDAVLQTDHLSLNWFCLAYQYAACQLEAYRQQVFRNTRQFLDRIPERLFHIKNVEYCVIPVRDGVDPAFVDVKIYGPLHEFKGGVIGGFLSLKCMEAKLPIFYRPSLGFYHTNFSMLFGEDCTTIRLTLGLDPAQVDLLADCFTMIDTLNGAPPRALLDKIHSLTPFSSAF